MGMRVPRRLRGPAEHDSGGPCPYTGARSDPLTGEWTGPAHADAQPDNRTRARARGGVLRRGCDARRGTDRRDVARRPGGLARADALARQALLRRARTTDRLRPL